MISVLARRIRRSVRQLLSPADASAEMTAELAERVEELAGVRRSYSRVSLERRAQPPWLRYLARNAVFAKAAAQLDIGDVHLIVAHDAPSFPAAAELAQQHQNARLVIDAVDVPQLDQRSSAAYQHFDRDPHGVHAVAAYESSVINAANAVLTVSRGLVSWFQDRHPEQQVLFVPNYRPVNEPTAEHAATLRTLGEGLYVVLPNASYPGTGAELAIEAIAQLPERFKLVIAGQVRPSTYQAQLQQMIDDLELTSRVGFSGPVPPDEVVASLATADIALISFEPAIVNMTHALPNRLFESLAARLPVVAGPLPDIGELLDTFEVGMSYTTHSPAAVAEALLRVAEGQATGAFSAGLDNAARLLTWEHATSDLVDAVPATANRQRCVIVANKLLAKNRRVPKLASWLDQRGYDVHIVSREVSHPSVKSATATYWVVEGDQITS